MAKKDELTLNIYNDKDEVVKTVTAKTISLRFGVVRALMEILNIDGAETTGDILSAIYKAWDEIKYILARIFPDVTVEELDGANLDELLPVVLRVIKYSLGEISAIPVDEKN